MSAEERIALQHQRDLSELFQDAIALYSQRFWSLFAIAAVVIPFGILTTILSNELAPTFEGIYQDEEVANEALRDMAVIVPLFLMQFFAQWLASLAVVAALAGLEGQDESELSPVMGREGTIFSRAYGAVFARFWTALGASLRVAAVALLPLAVTIGGPLVLQIVNQGAGKSLLSLGFLISVPWVAYHGIRWLFIYPAVILDRTSARAALSYSAHAVSGRWWRTLGIAVVIAFFVVLVPNLVVRSIFGLAPVYILSTASSVIAAALLPLGVIAMTLLYFDLKLRKESDVALGIA